MLRVGEMPEKQPEQRSSWFQHAIGEDVLS